MVGLCDVTVQHRQSLNHLKKGFDGDKLTIEQSRHKMKNTFLWFIYSLQVTGTK